MWHPSLQILSYNFAKFQAILLTLATLSACLQRPWLGEIRYREKGQKLFLLVCKHVAAFVIVDVLIFSLMA